MVHINVNLQNVKAVRTQKMNNYLDYIDSKCKEIYNKRTSN